MVFFVSSCKEEKQKTEVTVAKVGEALLTENQLQKEIGLSASTKYREEFIHDWINTELLSQIAKEKKLLTDNNYDHVINMTKKELAASIALNNYLSSFKREYSNTELRKHFKINFEDYRFSNEAYVLNLVRFENEENAITFRSLAITDGWQNALANFKENISLLESKRNSIYQLSDIQSKRIIRLVQKLYNNEISLVVKTELNNFIVVQQVSKIAKNTVPKFQFVKEQIRESFSALKNKERAINFLDSLLANKRVKIY